MVFARLTVVPYYSGAKGLVVWGSARTKKEPVRLYGTKRVGLSTGLAHSRRHQP